MIIRQIIRNFAAESDIYIIYIILLSNFKFLIYHHEH